MNFIDKFQVQETGRVRDQPGRLDIVCRETGNDRPVMGSFGEQKEYVMSATVSVRFHANSAQLSHHRQLAWNALTAQMFSNVRTQLHFARYALMNNDVEAALQCLGNIEQDLFKC